MTAVAEMLAAMVMAMRADVRTMAVTAVVTTTTTMMTMAAAAQRWRWTTTWAS